MIKVDTDLLESLYPNHSNEAIAKELGLTIRQLTNYVYRHNFNSKLKKNKEYISKLRTECVNISHNKK